MELETLAARLGAIVKADRTVVTTHKCGSRLVLQGGRHLQRAHCDNCGAVDRDVFIAELEEGNGNRVPDSSGEEAKDRHLHNQGIQATGGALGTLEPSPGHPQGSNGIARQANGAAEGHSNGNGQVVHIEADPRQAVWSWQYIVSDVVKQALEKPAMRNWAATDPASLRLDMLERLKVVGPTPPAILANGHLEDALYEVIDKYVPLRGPVAAVLELPDLTRKELEPLKWHQMRERRALQTREWVVEGKLARGETSSWSGKVEAGKTTLMRELTLCVLRGEPFLGCDVQKGRVAYIMLDADGEDVTFDSFEQMGFCDEDDEDTLFLFEPMMAQMDKGLEKLVALLLDFKPSLVIVDPYPRLKQIEDFHSYSNTYLMALLSYVARRVYAHFALPGHIPRGRDDDADVATTGFGSIAFSGGVNARFKVTNRNGVHTVASSKGKGAGFVPFESEMTLEEDPATHRIRISAVWSWKDKARGYKPMIEDLLEQHPDRCFDTNGLAKELRISRSTARAAANMLFGDQKIRRDGEGLKTDPYIYASLGYGGELTAEAAKNG
jgi:AAA domain